MKLQTSGRRLGLFKERSTCRPTVLEADHPLVVLTMTS